MHATRLTDAIHRFCQSLNDLGEQQTDLQLLRRFVDFNEEDAFIALMKRHASLVWGVALRRSVDRHSAEDVFQAAFLTLAPVANRLHGQTSLAGWLHTVTDRLARKTLRQVRSEIETPEVLQDPHPTPLDELSAQELVHCVDEEIQKLPDRYRLPLVLCCLEGLSRDEAAQQLGWSFHQLKGRLERGREILRNRLHSRGVSLPAAIGGVLLSSTIAPPDLLAITWNGLHQGTSERVHQLAQGMVQMLTRSSWNRVLVSCCMVVVLGMGILFASPSDQGKEDKPSSKSSKEKIEAPEKKGKEISVRIVHEGKPVPNAKVWKINDSVLPDQQKTRPETLLADDRGVIRIPYDAKYNRAWSTQLYAIDDRGNIGFNYFYGYQSLGDGGISPKTDYVLKLVNCGKVSGSLLTSDRKPIAGAVVEGYHFAQPNGVPRDDQLYSNFQIPHWEQPKYRTKTDPTGRFQLDGIPEGFRCAIKIRAEGFAEGSAYLESGKAEELKLPVAGTLRLKIDSADFEKIQGISWYLTEINPKTKNLSFHRDGELDGKRQILVSNLAPGKYRFTAPITFKHPVIVKSPIEVTVVPGQVTDLSLPLEQAVKIESRSVDATTGKGVPKVMVYIHSQSSVNSQENLQGMIESDSDGRLVGYGPANCSYKLSAYSGYRPKGYIFPDQGATGLFPLVEIKSGKSHTFPDIKLSKTTNLDFEIVDSKNIPLPGALLHPAAMWDSSIRNGNHLADEKGIVRLEDIDPEDRIAPRVRHGKLVNVPIPIDIGKQDGRATITLSEENACRVQGQVQDAKGNPVSRAKVSIRWHYWGVGKQSQYGTSDGLGSIDTDAEGRFQSGSLWPKDQYSVIVDAPGYSKTESKPVQGVSGMNHDLGRLTLVKLGGSISGTVVGLDGKPIEGVTVFNIGDAPDKVSIQTKADGRFQLTGLYDGSAFVFAHKEGYRFSGRNLPANSKEIKLVLRKASDPPETPPIIRDGHQKAEKEMTTHLLETLWQQRDHLNGYERNVFSGMARFNPELAKQWNEQEKLRSKGKKDYSKFLREVQNDRELERLAKEDIEEALASITNKDYSGIRQLIDLGESFLPNDKKKALRIAEEATVRSRSADARTRLMVLAASADLAIRAGNLEGGKYVLLETTEEAEKLGNDSWGNYQRGMVASYLAPHDWTRAKKILESLTSPDDYNRYFNHALYHIARSDPKKAKELLGSHKLGRLTYAPFAYLFVAFEYAKSDPDEAIALIEKVDTPTYRVMGLAHLAKLVAPKDPKRAWKILDRAMELLNVDSDQSRDFSTWSNYGGHAAIAGQVVLVAKEIQHPDLAAYLARALTCRTTMRYESSPEYRDRQRLQVAMIIAHIDPEAAKTILYGIAPPEEFIQLAIKGDRNWLFAIAVADPVRAKIVIDGKLNAGLEKRGGQPVTSDTGLIELISILTKDGDRMESLASYGSLPRIPGKPQ